MADSFCGLAEILLQQKKIETEDFATMMELFLTTVSAARKTLSFLQTFSSKDELEELESSECYLTSSRCIQSNSFDQMCFVETPKNVSKRKKYKNLGASSFEDSLKEAEPSEINEIWKYRENNNDVLINEKECCEETKDIKEPLKSLDIYDNGAIDNDTEPLSYADICRLNVDTQVNTVIVINETQNWRNLDQDSEAESCQNSFEDCSETNLNQSSVLVFDNSEHCKDESKVNSFRYDEPEIPNTPCISSVCDKSPTDVKISRKLSILDEHKFFSEPISPIIGLEPSKEDNIIEESLEISKYDLTTKDLVSAVNSTFNSSLTSSLKDGDKTDSVIQSPIVLKKPGVESRSISFCDEVDVFYFERCQGWGTVPKEGGNTLGMVSVHFHSAKEPCGDYEGVEEPLMATPEPVQEFKTRKSKRLSMNQSMPCLSSVSSSAQSSSVLSSAQSSSLGSEDISSSGEWISTIQKPGVIKLTKVASLSQINEEVELENIADLNKSKKPCKKNLTRNSGRSFLVSQINDSVLETSDMSLTMNNSKNGNRGELGTRGLERITSRKRKTLLKSCSVLNLDPAEAEECRKLRDSRREVGCSCYGGKCKPDTCPCAASGINCHEVHV